MREKPAATRSRAGFAKQLKKKEAQLRQSGDCGLKLSAKEWYAVMV